MAILAAHTAENELRTFSIVFLKGKSKKITNASIVCRGVWNFAPGVFALTHQRPQATLSQLFRKILANLSKQLG